MIFKKNIHIPVAKWRDLINNTDLRFFDHKKHLLLSTSREFEGYVIKVNSWDEMSMRNDYDILKKIKHQNIITPICYFEYEGDIFKYLSDENYDICDKEGNFEDISVVIRKYYPPLEDYEVLLNNEIYHQIVLSMFYLLFVHNIRINNLNISNVFFENSFVRNHMLKYNLFSKQYIIQSKKIVKFDLENIEILDKIEPVHFQELLSQLFHILQKIQCRKNVVFSSDDTPKNILELILQKI